MTPMKCGCFCGCPVYLSAGPSRLEGRCTFCREGRHDRVGVVRRRLLRLIHDQAVVGRVTTPTAGSSVDRLSPGVETVRAYEGPAVAAAAAKEPALTGERPG